MTSIVYQSELPCRELQACVARYWQIESDAPILHSPGRWSLPDGGSEWVFVLADPLMRGSHVHTAGAYAAGPALTACLSRATGRMSIVGVVFRPGGAAAVAPLPAHELTGHVVPLRSLWGEAGSDFAERMAGAAGFRSRVHLLQEELLAHLRPMDVEVTDAIQRLTSNPGVAVSRLTSDAASARRLQRKFLRHVGIGPKRLARMLRLQRATRLWASGQASSWAGLALAAGYSDQAHMVRDCREFAGTSPGRIAKFEGLMSYSFKTSHR